MTGPLFVSWAVVSDLHNNYIHTYIHTYIYSTLVYVETYFCQLIDPVFQVEHK